MSRNAWERLVERFADGRGICNCRQAYTTPCGVAFRDGERIENWPVCRYGCQAAQLDAKHDIATRVERLLSTAPDRA